MPKPIKKAIFPVGGLGTRFLPATKSMPKEMLTVVDKPLIHYAFDQARAAGIEEFIFVTGRNKSAIEDYFDCAYELEETLKARDKKELLARATEWVPPAGSIVYTRQMEPLGLGHAVWCARHIIGDEPFAVLLADELFLSERPLLQEMAEIYAEKGGNVLGVADVAREHTSNYGIIDPESDNGKIIKIKGMVEKPHPSKAPSNISITGQYILQPEIFGHLDEAVKRGHGKAEIQLTNAIAAMLKTIPTHGVRFTGRRYDCGSRSGFLQANIAFALEVPEMRADALAMMRRFLSDNDDEAM